MSKKWITLAALSSTFIISSPAFADYIPTPTAYIGIQGGWAKLSQAGFSRDDMALTGLSITSFSNSTKDSNWAGRALAGFQFDPNWALEVGWTRMKNFTSHATATYSNSTVLSGRGTIKTSAFDLVLKGMYYLQDNFNIYAKLGGAYLIEKGKVTGSSGAYTVSTTANNRSILPLAAIGLGYDITCNIATDLSWSHIQKVGKTDASNFDFVALGLSYRFA